MTDPGAGNDAGPGEGDTMSETPTPPPTIARIVGRPKAAPPNTLGIESQVLVRMSDGTFQTVPAEHAVYGQPIPPTE